MPLWSTYEVGSCRHNYKKFGGNVTDFCARCFEIDGYNSKKLRAMMKNGTIQLDGSCEKLQSSSRGDVAHVVNTTRSRKRTVLMAAEPTGKMNVNKIAKKATKSRNKRRKSTILSQQAEKAFDNGSVKQPLLRKLLSYVAGKENITVPQGGEKKVSKATEYRNKNNGVAVVNGALCLLNQNNPTAFRASVMEASVTQQPSLDANEHPAIKDKENIPDLQQQQQLATGDSSQGNQPEIAAFAKKISNQKNEMKLEETRKAMCDQFIAAMQKYEHPEARRPFLACFAECKKPEVERICNRPISEYEFNLAKLHARWPGALKAAPKVEISRQRIPMETLKRFLQFLEQPGNLQRYAFGTRILAVCKGKSVRELESIDCLKKVQKLAVDFILSLDAELATNVPELPTDATRCAKLERDTHRRCMNCRNHGGNCKFTPAGSMSRSTAIKLIKTLTGGEVKRLAGLDDTKVTKGRENFIRMRELTRSLVDDPTERNKLIEAIDESEIFYQTDYVDHLRRESNQACNCLSCGFSKVTERLCPGNHDPSCTECASGFNVIHKLTEHLDEKKAALAQAPGAADNPTMLKLDESAYNITKCKKDMIEFRSHLACHKAESDFDLNETSQLKDDTAVVVSDWKMKILACFYRENQARWFGKRGTSCLGFMIVSNSADPVVRAQGLKEVLFVMMLTDDTKQDDHAVACAKAEIYRNYLPEQISKVIFRADGAGCFKSSFHRAIQPHWETWTGIEEIVFRITPAGDGKSALDGMFGRLNSILSTAVDSGFSYNDSATSLKAVEASGGLSATKFLTFMPDRHTRLYMLYSEDTIKWGSILRTELNSNTRQLRAFDHSGYGNGIIINASQAHFATALRPTKKMLKNGSPHLLVNVPLKDHKGIKSMIERNLRSLIGRRHGAADDDEFHEKVELACGQIESAFFYSVTVPSMENLAPQSLHIVAGVNAKQDHQSFASMTGEGGNHPHMRQARRRNRTKKKAERIQDAEANIRQKKSEAGIFLCDARCPASLHYCSLQFLTEKNRNKHVATERHKFPRGISSVDRVVELAANAGGLLMVGTRRDRKKSADTTVKFFPSVDVNTAGADDALCFNAFHRKEDTDAYHKPAKLQEELDRLFACRPKLSPEQAQEIMRQAIDPVDGGLKFCYAKRGEFMAQSRPEYATWVCSLCGQKPCNCNGMLLSIDQITSAFSTRATKEKQTTASKDYSATRGREDGP